MVETIMTTMSKTVLITGTSTRFGHATATLFADRGWNVVATMRSPSAAGSPSDRKSVLVARLDVTDKGTISSAIKAGIDRFGKLDAVINNAGYGQYGIFEAIPAEKIQKHYDVNVFGVMNVMRAIVPVFREQGGGLILNVSSCGGLFALPAISIYLSTKFAIEGFTESVSYELASQNIVVKMVEPGGGDTAFHARAAADATGAAGLKSYDAFLSTADAAIGRIAIRMQSPKTISEVIYGAVTDGTRRPRYFAGEDVKQFVDARRTMSDEDYEIYMRGQLA
jgi:NAD(P)-dependent dehydrogenase (short-subunit alcohol dehydrogenase family)